MLPADWFQYKDLNKRPFDKSVWIPLRASQTIRAEKKFGAIGYVREAFCCGTLAIPISCRVLGDNLGWSDIGLIHEIRAYSGQDGYKQAQDYWLDWTNGPQGPLGVELVLPQSFGYEQTPIWHLNQDLVLSFNLKQEGDTWVCPDEGYLDIIRLSRNSAGSPEIIEIRSEFLKDYLAARNMALRLVWYRDRDAIVSDSSNIFWGEEGLQNQQAGFRFEARNYPIHLGSGSPFGSQSAVFYTWRTDVDKTDDVPEFGPESDGNTGHTSRTFDDVGRKAFRIEGEIWAEEWIEPAKFSQRIRRDQVPSATAFIVDASGRVENADVLDNEDIGKYLWFRADIINDLLRRRGVIWKWHTRDTGSIQLALGEQVHFGLNTLGFINTYAYDIAKLPEWQRRIWQGYNIAPDGGVCAELLQSQMQALPANTSAPEAYLLDTIVDIDIAFRNRFSKNLFRQHPSRSAIGQSLHRFRAIAQGGIFSLAKDITRVIIEALDIQTLHGIAAPINGEGTGSLKSLERVLALCAPSSDARGIISPLVGIYELRGADAHLPKSELDYAFKLVGVSSASNAITQGQQLLMGLMRSLVAIKDTLELDAQGGT